MENTKFWNQDSYNNVNNFYIEALNLNVNIVNIKEANAGLYYSRASQSESLAGGGKLTIFASLVME